MTNLKQFSNNWGILCSQAVAAEGSSHEFWKSEFYRMLEEAMWTWGRIG